SLRPAFDRQCWASPACARPASLSFGFYCPRALDLGVRIHHRVERRAARGVERDLPPSGLASERISVRAENRAYRAPGAPGLKYQKLRNPLCSWVFRKAPKKNSFKTGGNAVLYQWFHDTN